ncbi:uncharacterized protein EAF01_008817 [Botrytis porri]|uniref:Major facilitator superfamily (MFS) profile domain-containing protein n=1 Tax=Botrytis porri TaxID=87229 RepID=A0A4Z1KNA7_9HELO|nr:uncharacterized protein EAF01_008817 [Botrytis porri]KAF7897851.1 hypothetical protein EAF01_008817 [Botrytis porri]TGO82715.1 hypothetical protein BPOR_0772g00070 [Botrytis porri]
MSRAGVEEEGLPAEDRLDELDYMDEEFLEDSETSLLRESDPREEDVVEVGNLYLICLAISTGGLQVIWTAIMSQGSPYLVSLSVPSYLISLVWLAGPLSGAIVQPYIGILSDRSEHSLGRRRPFIIIGTIATIVCILALPWTTDLISYLFALLGSSPVGRGAMICKGVIAAAWIWALNIAIQPVQGGLRAIVVDCVPPKQQVKACGYASAAAGIGSILGYTAGYVSLPKYLPWLGDTQLKGLCLIASLALGSTVAVTCFTAKEKRFVYLDASPKKQSFARNCRQIFSSVKTCSREIRKICIVQFFAWIGWFPFLFYITSYLGGLYEAEYTAISKKETPTITFPTTSPHSIRHATFVMILFALVALISNLTLPLFISSSSISSKDQKPTFVSRLHIKFLTLPRVWTLSQIFTTLLTLSTLLTSSFVSTSVLIIFLGISWATTTWIPLALISTEISQSQHRSRSTTSTSSIPLSPIAQPASSSHKRNKIREPLQAGTIMGLFNMAIALPQIIAALQGSLVFWVLGEVGVVGTEAMGWVIRLGCLGSMFAAWLADSL